MRSESTATKIRWLSLSAVVTPDAPFPEACFARCFRLGLTTPPSLLVDLIRRPNF